MQVLLATVQAVPPVDATAPDTAAWLFTIWVSLAALAFLPFAVVRFVRAREALPLLLVASALIASLGEPMIATLGNIWYPRDVPLTLYSNFGIEIPLLVATGYVCVGAAAAYGVRTLLERGLTAMQVARVWLGLILAEAVLEYPGTIADIHVYWGDQPFELFGFPWWYAVVNGTCILMCGVLAHVLPPLLAGARRVLILGLVPAGILGTYGVTAWPVLVALNADVSAFVEWSAALLTMGLCWGLVTTVAPLVARSTAEQRNERIPWTSSA